jgi:RNA polymerase sigma-70 factor (ECF subfamily)
VAVWDGDLLFGLVAFEMRDGLTSHVRTVLNPDKLVFAQRQLRQG